MMTINNSHVPESRKRMRQNDDHSSEGIARKISRIDDLTTREAHRLLFDSDPFLLQQGLDLQMTGNLRSIHFIHETANAICNPAERQDRAVLRMVKRIPDVLTVNSLLPPKLLNSLQEHLLHVPKKSTLYKDRLLLVYLQARCQIGAKITTEITRIDTGDKDLDHTFLILFQKALECAYELDGEKAFGSYLAKLFIVQSHEPAIFSRKSPENFHHDFLRDRDNNPTSTFLKYSFLGMLSDKEGEHGWDGGDLIIQNDSTSRPFVPDQKHLPSLRYQYPLNEGVLLRNKSLVHKSTGISAKNPEMPTEITRNLLAITLFEDEIRDSQKKSLI